MKPLHLGSYKDGLYYLDEENKSKFCNTTERVHHTASEIPSNKLNEENYLNNVVSSKTNLWHLRMGCFLISLTCLKTRNVL